MGLFDRMLTDLVVGATGLDARATRRMVRRIGTGNLLMMGAAAALGGLAVAKTAPAAQPGAAPLPPLPQLPAAPRTASRSQPLPESGRSSASAAPAGAPIATPIATPIPTPIPTAIPTRIKVPPPPPPAAAPESLPPLPPLPPPSGSAAEAAEAAGSEELPPEALLPAVRTMVAAALADGELAAEERRLILSRLDESGLPEEAVHQVHQDLVVPPSPAELAGMVADPAARETLYRAAALVVLADRRVSDAERAWLDRLAGAFGFGPEARRRLEDELFAGEGIEG